MVSCHRLVTAEIEQPRARCDSVAVRADQRYHEVVSRAEGDPSVLGLVLGGGRGKGVFSAASDYDIAIVVTNDVPEDVAKGYRSLYEAEVIDIHVLTLDEFRRAGDWGSTSAWAAYGFSHLTAQIDKTGEIQVILDRKGTIPADEVPDFVERSLDAFLNQYYRAFKNHRDGHAIAARLDAVECIPLLLNVLFGEEGRVRPYNKFLEWELTRYPLRCMPWDAGAILKLVRSVLEDGDIAPLTELYRRTRDAAIGLGFTRAISGWEGYTLE